MTTTEMTVASVTPSQLQINNPADVMEFAKTLKRFIDDNKLSCIIQGKSYVYVDGWKFAGVNFGIIPIVDEPVNLSDEKEIKYKCSCRLVRMSDDRPVGSGFAICSNLEQKKKSFDEYAVASMAQTRAIAKAYRNLLGFIMNAAGFESTPADEMEGMSEANKTDFGTIREQVMLMNTLEELRKYYEQDSLKQYHGDKVFNEIFHKRKLQIVKPVKK